MKRVFILVFFLAIGFIPASAQLPQITEDFVRGSLRGERLSGWTFGPDEPLEVNVLKKQTIDSDKRIRVIAWIKTSDVKKRNFVEGRLKLIYNRDLSLKSIHDEGLSFSGEDVERAEQLAAEKRAADERAAAERRIADERAAANYSACPVFKGEVKLSGGGQWSRNFFVPRPGRCLATFSAYNDNDDATEVIFDAVLRQYIRRKSPGDIEILIYDEFNYLLRLQNRNHVALYSSGRQTSGRINVILPAGNLVIVVSNQHSYLVRKSVSLSLGEIVTP